MVMAEASATMKKDAAGLTICSPLCTLVCFRVGARCEASGEKQRIAVKSAIRDP